MTHLAPVLKPPRVVVGKGREPVTRVSTNPLVNVPLTVISSVQGFCQNIGSVLLGVHKKVNYSDVDTQAIGTKARKECYVCRASPIPKEVPRFN